MTASPWPRPATIPTNAVDLSDLMYRETCTPETWIGLVSQLGYADAFRVWWDATALLEQRAPKTRYGLLLDGVDHDPVPGEAATVCGCALVAVPVPSDLTRPQGDPCGDCFGPTP